MELISKSTPQFKANLHSHSVLSDGKLTSEELVSAYKGAGYSVLAITDHEAPYDHTGLSDASFLMLTGYEVYIRPSAECKLDPFGPEIHMNLLAKDPHNTAFINYDPNFVKYMPAAEAAKREKLGSLGPRKYNREYIQAFINDARRAGYLVAYNHPCWSMEAQEEILNYDGFFSLEIFNTGSMKINGYEYNLALYDQLLRRGKFLGVHGADDNHNKKPFGDLLCDSFGAREMILAPELSYGAVIDALEKKNFYASTGPEIYSLSSDGKTAHFEFSDAQRAVMHMSPKRAVNVYTNSGSIRSADFAIPGSAPYAYFSVFAADGTSAHTRAFTREELGL